MKQNNRKYWKWILPAALILLWLTFIWRNSTLHVEESAMQSLPYVELLKPLLKKLGVPKLSYGHVVRKTAHMLEFFVLGVMIGAAALYLLPRKWKKAYRALTAFLICAAAGAADEWIQTFQPGRSGELIDVARDCAGALVGILCAVLIQCIHDRVIRKKQRKSP